MDDKRSLLLGLDPGLKDRLDAAAEGLGRSSEHVALEAIEEYLAVQDWQAAGIRRGIAALDRGHAILHEEVETWVGSWDSDSERPKPKAP